MPLINTIVRSAVSVPVDGDVRQQQKSDRVVLVAGGLDCVPSSLVLGVAGGHKTANER